MSFRRFNPFTPNAIPAPTYLSNESISGAHSRSESVRTWSVADSDIVIDPAESTLKDTASVTGSSVEIARLAGPRYGELEYYPYLISLKNRNPSVYYRVYAKDGAIPTVNPVYSDDSYLGRILARCVAPPHTASSLRRCLSTVENIGVNHHTSLFIATSSESPMDDSGRISVLVHSGLGYTPNEPVALVVNSPRAAMFRTAFPVADQSRQFQTRYSKPVYYYYHESLGDQLLTVYYRLYAEDGEIPTMNPVYSDDPYLGRISATLVAPPHTAGSLRRCLSSVENIGAGVQTSLFVATSSGSPMGDSDRMSILVQSGPGYIANEPVALVVSSSRATPLASQIKQRAEQGPMPFEPRYREWSYKSPRLLTPLISCHSVLPSLYKQCFS
jgi:hypothetical protein